MGSFHGGGGRRVGDSTGGGRRAATDFPGVAAPTCEIAPRDGETGGRGAGRFGHLLPISNLLRKGVNRTRCSRDEDGTDPTIHRTAVRGPPPFAEAIGRTAEAGPPAVRPFGRCPRPPPRADLVDAFRQANEQGGRGHGRAG